MTEIIIAKLLDKEEYYLSRLGKELFYIRSANIWKQSKLMQQAQSEFIVLADTKNSVHNIVKSLRETRLKIIELQISLL